MSTMCMNASACLKSSKNWFPFPLPWCAPGTSPATSRTSTGTNLLLFMQYPYLGLHCTPSSLSTQSILMNANALFGFIVAKG